MYYICTLVKIKLIILIIIYNAREKNKYTHPKLDQHLCKKHNRNQVYRRETLRRSKAPNKGKRLVVPQKVQRISKEPITMTE